MIIRIEVCECDVCAHRWLATLGRPKRCAKCKSARWNVESATEQELVELPSVALVDRRQLPDTPGLYFVTVQNELQYIGLAKQLDRRWEQHERLPKLREMEGVRIAWIATPGIDLESLTELEAVLICELDPPLNGRKPFHVLHGKRKRLGLSLSPDVIAILNRYGRSETLEHDPTDTRPTRTQIIEAAVREWAGFPEGATAETAARIWQEREATAQPDEPQSVDDAIKEHRQLEENYENSLSPEAAAARTEKKGTTHDGIPINRCPRHDWHLDGSQFVCRRCHRPAVTVAEKASVSRQLDGKEAKRARKAELQNSVGTFLDATGPTVESGRGKATVETQPAGKPRFSFKPLERGNVQPIPKPGKIHK